MLGLTYNLGQNKMKPPSPQIKDEAVQKPKRFIFPSLILGGRGWNEFSFYFVQDCSYYNIGHVNECGLSSCYFCSGEQNWTLLR